MTFSTFRAAHPELSEQEALREFIAVAERAIARSEAWQSIEVIHFPPADDFGELPDDIVIALESGDEELVARCQERH